MFRKWYNQIPYPALADRFESYVVENPKDRFSRDEAHSIHIRHILTIRICNGSQYYRGEVVGQHMLVVFRGCVFFGLSSCPHIFWKHLKMVNALSYGPGHAKMCLMPYANNKGADQPAHLRSLISTFIVRCLVWYIYLLYPKFQDSN